VTANRVITVETTKHPHLHIIPWSRSRSLYDYEQLQLSVAGGASTRSIRSICGYAVVGQIYYVHREARRVLSRVGSPCPGQRPLENGHRSYR
jgi:hypothetical protein